MPPGRVKMSAFRSSSSSSSGIIEVIPWSMSGFLNVSRGWLPSHGPGDLHYFGQIAALNDCLYRNMYRSKYVALHDVDELILPQTVKTYEKRSHSFSDDRNDSSSSESLFR